MDKHVSCKRCGHIWHDSDLDKKGYCPDCRDKPPPKTAAAKKEVP